MWHLAQSDTFVSRDRCVVFVSNAERKVPLWCQRAGAPDQPVVWDYHVLLFVRDPDWRVYDLDSTLPRGIGFSAYFAATFRLVSGAYAPRFRVMSADDYVAALATDRSHMLKDGVYVAPPPEWPPIGEGSNVMRFVDLEDAIAGEVLDAADLVRRFT